MSQFQPVPVPEKDLERYRVLSPTAGVRVSPLQLGAMSIGQAWSAFMGSMDKKSSFELLDAFWEAGGNFIDTANNYQAEESELFIGEWVEQKGIRDELVIATKYTTDWKKGQEKYPRRANYVGNGNKSLHLSVNASLKKLRTSYIDLLYVHWWDWDTSIEEVMRSLHALVLAGKVLYIGISDSPAWVVAAANTYAKDHALTPFSVYQGKYSLLERDLEREVFPMCRQFGMGISLWNVLGGGKFRSDKEEEEREKSGENGRTFFGDWKRTEPERKVSNALDAVANKITLKDGSHPSLTAVALAHALTKTLHVFPIVGGRKVSHLQDNIKSLEIVNGGLLTPELIKELEDATPFDVGFPSNFIGNGVDSQCFIIPATAYFDRVEAPQAIGYKK